MPDTPIDRPGPTSYDPSHEARISRLEDEMHEVKSTLGQMLPVLVRIDSMLTATLPHLATKAELQELRTESVNAQANTAAQFAKAREETQAEFSRVERHTDARFDAVNAAIAAIRTDVTVIRTDMAHVATKAELAEKPSKAYLWGVLAALIAAYGIGLAGLAILR